MIDVNLIKETLIPYLYENLLTTNNFILYSQINNESILINFNKKTKELKNLKAIKDPDKSLICVYDNKYLTQNEIDHAIALTNYTWDFQKQNGYVILLNGIEFIGGDIENSIECINPIISYDKFLKN